MRLPVVWSSRTCWLRSSTDEAHTLTAYGRDLAASTRYLTGARQEALGGLFPQSAGPRKSWKSANSRGGSGTGTRGAQGVREGPGCEGDAPFA